MGYFLKIQELHCNADSQWCSAQKRGSTSTRSRSDLFVTVHLLDETSAVPSLGKLCDDHGYSYEWVSGQKPRLTKEVKTFVCKTDNFVPLVDPGLSTSSGSNSSSTSTSQDLSTTSPAQERSDELAPREWCGSPSKTQNKNKKGMAVEMRTTVCEIFLDGWRSSQQIWRIQKCMHRTHFSGLRFGVPYESGIKIKEAQSLYSLPKRSKLRSLLANYKDKGSLQKTHWRSSTSSRKVW